MGCHLKWNGTCTNCPCHPSLQFREQAGIESFADFAAMLGEAPKPLLDSLRQSAVVRHSGKRAAAQLCCIDVRQPSYAAWIQTLASCSWGCCTATLQRSRALSHLPAGPRLPAATLLGATLSDRLRLNATWARRGLYASAPGAGQPEFVGRLQSRIM